jgi:hypothetical protein
MISRAKLVYYRIIVICGSIVIITVKSKESVN